MLKRLRKWLAAPNQAKPVRRMYRPLLEGLEERAVPASTTVGNFWIASQGSSAAWEVVTNWSLLHAPTSTEDAVFDVAHSSIPCVLGAGLVAAPASVQFGGGWTGTLTVNGSISTPTLTLTARPAAGPGIIIGSGSQVEVTGAMTFGGGNVSGSGKLLVDGGGKLSVTGTSAADRPTLGCNLQLGSSDGSTTGSMEFGPNIAVQPLVVTGNASIIVNNQSFISFDGRPLAGNQSVTAISNGDAGSETITVNTGGQVLSSGAYEQIVGMGVANYGGYVIAGNSSGNGTLHFTGNLGPVFGSTGLLMNSGSLNVNGSMAFDYGALIQGGTVQELNSSSVLTLGLTSTSGVSSMTGGTMNLPGTLVAHGGFNLAGGSLNTTGSTLSTIQVDNGTVFTMSGGTVTLATLNSATNPSAVVGNLLIQGDFSGTGGTLQDLVCTVNGNFSLGRLWVSGKVTFGPGLTFSCYDVATNPQGPHTWYPIEWSGTRSGNLSTNLTASPGQGPWTYSWDDTNGRLVINEP
jgi:hypothetical protein